MEAAAIVTVTGPAAGVGPGSGPRSGCSPASRPPSSTRRSSSPRCRRWRSSALDNRATPRRGRAGAARPWSRYEVLIERNPFSSERGKLRPRAEARALGRPFRIVDLAQAQIPFTQKLPGATRRAEVTGKLRWHKDQLALLAPSALSLALTGGNPEALKANMAKMSAIYASGADEKEWVLQAFIEANAVREGVTALSTMWDDMWTEIIEALKKLPVAVAKAAGNVVKEVQWYARAATWLIIGGGVLALGIIATGVGLGVSNRISGK